MFFKRIQDVNGDYIAEDNTRYVVSSARRVRNPHGINIGYEEFPSLEDALKAWNLTQLSS